MKGIGKAESSILWSLGAVKRWIFIGKIWFCHKNLSGTSFKDAALLPYPNLYPKTLKYPPEKFQKILHRQKPDFLSFWQQENTKTEFFLSLSTSFPFIRLQRAQNKFIWLWNKGMCNLNSSLPPKKLCTLCHRHQNGFSE